MSTSRLSNPFWPTCQQGPIKNIFCARVGLEGGVVYVWIFRSSRSPRQCHGHNWKNILQTAPRWMLLTSCRFHLRAPFFKRGKHRWMVQCVSGVIHGTISCGYHRKFPSAQLPETIYCWSCLPQVREHFPWYGKIWSRATSRLQRNHAKLQSFIFSTEQFLETELSNDKFLECFCRISIIFWNKIVN